MTTKPSFNSKQHFSSFSSGLKLSLAASRPYQYSELGNIASAIAFTTGPHFILFHQVMLTFRKLLETGLLRGKGEGLGWNMLEREFHANVVHHTHN